MKNALAVVKRSLKNVAFQKPEDNKEIEKMKIVKYIRKGKIIKPVNATKTHQIEVFASINKAKKASRKLQMAENSALGLGSLQVA